MMMPATSYSSSSGASASAFVRVDKATSEFLSGPDWTLNIDICDTINSNHWLSKDVVRALKKRLQHKSPKVQLLALTLLETMVKNCGDHVHFQIAERNILPEMIKIVKKKADMNVRDKILVLLDSWQEAFGGRGGKYPQYYFAYEELRNSGIQFPQRTPDAVPIFTPPVTHPNVRQLQAGYGMPVNSSTRLDEAMASEIENLSLSSIESMRSVSDLLSDMLQAANPNDRAAVKDEVIVDVVHRCRSNQKKLMQMLTTTTDEELLGQGLELNDTLQFVLAKHDAIASGMPMPTHVTSSIARSTDMREFHPKPTEVSDVNSASDPTPSASVPSSSKNVAGDEEEEEEEEDDFAQLARRHSKTQSGGAQSSSAGTGEGISTTDTDPSVSMALALSDPTPPVKTTKDQDMIDFLSLALSTSTDSPQAPQTPPIDPAQNIDQTSTQNFPHASQPYPLNQGQVPTQSYVVPWAQAQPQSQPQTQPQSWAQGQTQPQPQPQSWAQGQTQPQPQTQPQSWAQGQTRPQPQPQPQPWAQPQSQFQSHPQPQPWAQAQAQAQHQYQPQRQPWTQAQPQARSQPHPQQAQAAQQNLTSAYPPPPWAATPGYYNNPAYPSPTSYTTYSTPRTTTYMPGGGSSQQVNSVSPGGNNVAANNVSSNPSSGQRPFIPSYRLFEDLNVLGGGDGRSGTSNSSTSLTGSSGQSMVSGKKW